jgi:hypothetical protein
MIMCDFLGNYMRNKDPKIFSLKISDSKTFKNFREKFFEGTSLNKLSMNRARCLNCLN